MIFSRNIQLEMINDSSSVIRKCTSTDPTEFLLPEMRQDIRYIRLNQPKGEVPSYARWCLSVLLVAHLGQDVMLDISLIDCVKMRTTSKSSEIMLYYFMLIFNNWLSGQV